MLSEDKILELNRIVAEGQDAKELLGKLSKLKEKKEELIYVSENMKSCEEIIVSQGYNKQIRFKVDIDMFALEKLREIIEREKENIVIKISRLE